MNPKLRADGGQMIVSRPVATHVWGGWSVTLPENSEQVGTDERVRQGFSYRIPGAKKGLFDRRFVRADVSFDVPKKLSDFEEKLDTAAKKVQGGVFFERDITSAGLGLWRPLRDFHVGDMVDVLIWGKVMPLLVTSIEQTTGGDGVVGWRVHVGGQMIRDLKSLATKSGEVERQILEERRQRLGAEAETRSIARNAAEKVTEALEVAGGAVEQVKSFSEQAREFSLSAKAASDSASEASKSSVAASEESLKHSQKSIEHSALSLQYSQAASQASDAASKSSTQAAAHTSSANSYSIAAATSKDDAQKFMLAAEESRRLAENARGVAEEARDSAETARDGAEVARSSAETARGAAERDRQRAESARSSAEAFRDEAETARSNAETARSEAEKKRDEAERERVKSEAARGEAVKSAKEAADSALENQRLFEEMQRERDAAQDKAQEALVAMQLALAQKVVAGKLLLQFTTKQETLLVEDDNLIIRTDSGTDVVYLHAKGDWTGRVIYTQSTKDGNNTTVRKREFSVPFPGSSRGVYPFRVETPKMVPRSDFASWAEVEYWVSPQKHGAHHYNIPNIVTRYREWSSLHRFTMPRDVKRMSISMRVGWHDASYGNNYGLDILRNGKSIAQNIRADIGETWNILLAYRTQNLTIDLTDVKRGDVFDFHSYCDNEAIGRREIDDGKITISYFY